MEATSDEEKLVDSCWKRAKRQHLKCKPVVMKPLLGTLFETHLKLCVSSVLALAEQLNIGSVSVSLCTHEYATAVV